MAYWNAGQEGGMAGSSGSGGSSPPKQSESKGKQPLKNTKRAPNNYREEIIAVVRRRIIDEGGLTEEESQTLSQSLEQIIITRRIRTEIDFDHDSVIRFTQIGLIIVESDLLAAAARVRRRYSRSILHARSYAGQQETLFAYLRYMLVGYDDSPQDLQPLLSAVSLMALEMVKVGYPNRVVVDIVKYAILFVEKEWKVDPYKSMNDEWQFILQVIGDTDDEEQTAPPPHPSTRGIVPRALLNMPTGPMTTTCTLNRTRRNYNVGSSFPAK